MKLHEKIRHIRKNVLRISLKDFHQKRLVPLFGDNAISLESLLRIEKGYRRFIRVNSLYQICTGLGITMKELKDGTEEEGSKIVNIIKANERSRNKYIYNELAYAEILSDKSLNILAIELTLEPGGKTKLEQDSVENLRFEKMIVVLQGSLLCSIGAEKHLLKKNDTLSFQSSIPHYFENSSKTTCRCIIIQNPKSY